MLICVSSNPTVIVWRRFLCIVIFVKSKIKKRKKKLKIKIEKIRKIKIEKTEN